MSRSCSCWRMSTGSESSRFCICDDLALHLLDQLVEGLRRVVAEEVAVLLHEGVEVRLAALHLVLQHLVEVADHLLHALPCLRATCWRSGCCMSLKKVSIIAFFSISMSSWNSACASGSMNS